MLETPHVAVGIAIAAAIPNPLISIPLAFMSHFILDMTPHWNPHLNSETKRYGQLTNSTLLIIGFDLACAAILTAYIGRRDLIIYMASFAAILPDIVEGPYYLFGFKNKYLEIWRKFQKSIQSDANVFWGLTTQILTLLAAFFWFFAVK